MLREACRLVLPLAALWVVAGCDRLGLEPKTAASTPITPAPAIDSESLRRNAGVSYSDFVGGEGASYGPDALGLTAADRARVWRAMGDGQASALIEGGGAEALVFRGCAETGCGDGASVVAVDTSTGAAFVGVRDVGGVDVLAPNERVEALLRLNSPTRDWTLAAPVSTAGEP